MESIFHLILTSHLKCKTSRLPQLSLCKVPSIVHLRLSLYLSSTINRSCQTISLSVMYNQSSISDYMGNRNNVSAYLADCFFLRPTLSRCDLLSNQVKDLPEGGRPFFYLEVIDWNSEAVRDDEYFGDGYVTGRLVVSKML